MGAPYLEQNSALSILHPLLGLQLRILLELDGMSRRTSTSRKRFDNAIEPPFVPFGKLDANALWG